MKLTIENTDKIVTLVVSGVEVPARIWQGVTEEGVDVHLYVARVAVHNSYSPEVHKAFGEALKEVVPMRPDVAGIPLRLIL